MKPQESISVAEAARVMGVSPQFLRLSLQREGLPFGTAVQFDKRWSYYINRERFEKYMSGEDMKGVEK